MAAITGGALADAQPQNPGGDDRPHLLVVPTTPEGEAALALTDARVVASYKAFSLVEAAGADDKRLREAGADRRDDMRTVRTAAGQLDPKRERPSLAGKQAPGRDEVLATVQFIGPPKDAWLERVRSTGARIVIYQAENSYVVHANGEEVDRLAALVGSYAPVRAVAPLTATDKLDSPRSATGRYAVQTVSGAEGAQARDEAAAAGAGVGRSVGVGHLQTQYLALSAAEAAELARDPAVVAVEPYGEPGLADERGAQIVAGNLTAGFVPTGSFYLGWLVNPTRIPDESTFDFAIDVTDEGLDGGIDPPAHSDFRTLGSGASRLAYLNNYSSDAGTDSVRDCGGHGTNVASIAAGYNHGSGALVEDGAGYNHGLGVAPFAKVGASKIFNCAGAVGAGWTPANLASNAYAETARISNNSWGTRGLSSWSDYSARSREYDAVVRDARPSQLGNQGMVEIFAAGNDGEGNDGSFNEGYATILAEATAKNVISVGAAESVHASGMDGCDVPNSGADSARDIVDFASRGPTDDGRLKPDLVAPGSHITGARPRHSAYTGSGACTPFFGGSSAFYSLISGSSQAAPQVAGAAALVRHWYTRPRGIEPTPVEPTPALTKALLINTATDLAGGQNGKGDTIAAGPNTDQGWGRVNVGNALAGTVRDYRDQLPEDVLGASGTSTTPRAYAVQDTGAPVKVTLAWTDAPGPITGNSFVNDLDLQVEAGGQTYRGNVFDREFSRTGGSSDTRNNVESVYLPAGTSGPFAVKVVGSNIPGDGVPGNGDPTDQDFALVVSNAKSQAAPVLVHDATAIDDSVVAGGDGDGALEPTESFELDERLRNAGAAGATNLSGNLTAGSNLTVTQGASAWPNLAAADSGTNQTPLAGTVGGACGTDAIATLALSSDQGTHSVPLALPTGAEGDLEARLLAPGSAIPDDSAAGLSSIITVGTVGRIKDLDVRLNIVHDWVGDLRIDLIAPDGTAVRLAEHPGGPDNSGKDLTNTVFDDEAPTSIASGAAPYTGRYRPQNDQLARFNGKQQMGDWTLRVRDLYENETGTLNSWGTDTRPAICAVSTAPPETTIASGPAEGGVVGSSAATLGFSSNVGGATFECRLDGGSYGPCSSPKSYTGLVDGTHTFRVRAVNGALKDSTPATRTWTSDTTPPSTSITAGPAQNERVGSSSASFQFVSPDTPNATFECRVDSQSFSICSEPHVVSALSDGLHTFRVRAWDAVGNIDASPAQRSWIVDTTAPLPTVDGPSASTEDSQPTLTGTGGTAPGDATTVAVRLYEGDDDPPSSPPLHTMSASVAPNGRWSVDVPAALALGPHRAEVEQTDVSGNVRTSPLWAFEVVEDFASPIVTLTAPANGSTTADPRPTLAGVAGTLDGDDGLVTLELWNGTLAGGMPAQTLIVPRDSASGAFSGLPAALAEGTYTARARQGDSALPSRNTGESQLVTFNVNLPDPPPEEPTAAQDPPSFALAPAEERLSDALANRYTVLAACDSACRVNAELTVSAAAARKLGMRARAVAIGDGSKRLSKAGAAAVKVGLTSSARKALRGEAGSTATLNVTVRDGDGTELALKRKVTLRRSAGLSRVVSRGMGLWSVCSTKGEMRGALRISAAHARKLGLKPKSGARVTIASGRATSGRSPKKLTLKVSSSAKKALRGASRLSALLEASAGSASSGRRTASRSLTLR